MEAPFRRGLSLGGSSSKSLNDSMGYHLWVPNLKVRAGTRTFLRPGRIETSTGGCRASGGAAVFTRASASGRLLSASTDACRALAVAVHPKACQ
jgi:hypothetical protein